MHPIDALDRLVGEAKHGGMHRFVIMRADDSTPYQVERVMRQYGIRIWGREADDPETFAFAVRRGQAKWAEYVLCRAGLHVLSPLVDPENRRRTRRAGMPKPWQREGIGAVGIVDRIVDWLAGLAGADDHGRPARVERQPRRRERV